MNYFLGVDAGNTKTIALVAHSDGTILGAGRSGCGDIYTAACGDDLPSVAAAVDAALRPTGIQPHQLMAGGFSMAGADYPEDFAFITAAVRRWGYGQTVTVVNDAIGPLWAGTDDGIGVAVACGTSAATGARAGAGRVWHSSFWQHPTGGHELGRKALQAVFAAEIGIGPATALREQVLAFYDETDVARVLHRMTARNTSEGNTVRHLARILLDTAHDGDHVAATIVQEHGAGLGALAVVAARQVGLGAQSFPLVLTGGVLRHPTHLLAEALVTRVHSEMPHARPVQSRFEPAIGALFLAMQSVELPIGEDVRARVAASSPPSSFFKSDEEYLDDMR